jgi:alkanesulfonate monooxygenase SsuD/methylene tetrahydromethanopterin reductase-like flavin-dependent oxidoreductase (luciferase family)
MPERFAPFAELHRRAARQAGNDPLPALSINSHGYIAETSQQALDESFPAVAAMMNRIGRERGWTPMLRQD